MLFRKISAYLKAHFSSSSDKILIIEGARQIGKSFIIQEIGKKFFKNFIALNFVEDDVGTQLFKNVRDTEEFYFRLSTIAGTRLGNFNDTLIFLDEIQHYPQFLTLLKFFRQEKRFRFIASGSLLGITLNNTASLPIGSVIRKQMFQLDFEEFLIANNWNENAINALRERFEKRESLSEEEHSHLLSLFKRYLLIGGMPDAVNEYLASHNIVRVREIQENIRQMYEIDATKYENDSRRNLSVRRIFEMLPSQMENKKKRIVAKTINNQTGDRFDRYQEEFEYLISSGISSAVRAISNPNFPLLESVQKKLLKLYMNDVGILTNCLYRHNLSSVLDDKKSVNLGGVYETVAAQELRAHGNALFYYDNRKNGEVDFLIDDFSQTSILPIEIKSGKDYTTHSALNNLLTTPNYNIKSAFVFSNERKIKTVKKITYLPIYYIMFLGTENNAAANNFF